jgi:hypothetical protein
MPILLAFIRRIDSWWKPRHTLWFGWILFLIYCYPGYMSTDSVDQLLQARGEIPVHDWYPPVMSMLWRATDSIIAGPFPMLVIQSTTFLLGANAILRHVLRPRRAAALAVLVLLFPPVLTTMAVIWKDSQMAAFLLAGIAGLLSERKRWRVFGCMMLCLAGAQRYNALVATLPIVLLLFTWRPGASRVRRYALAIAVWVAITAVGFVSNRVFTEKETHAWHGSVALLDIVGTIRYAPKLTDEQVREHLAGLTINVTENLQFRFRRAYSTRMWFHLVNGEGRILETPLTAEDRAVVSHVWLDLVTTYPRAYLGHRMRVFQSAIGLDGEPPTAAYDGFTENPDQLEMAEHRAKHSTLQQHWVSLIPELEHLVIFQAWAYLVLGMFLVVLGRRSRLVVAMVSSGLLNELGLIVVAPSVDYRYSHWLIVTVVIAGVLVFAMRFGAGRAAKSLAEDHRQ